jgi:glutamate formiminotransferase/formiminotetrahydrofolate cyclodeaminase
VKGLGLEVDGQAQVSMNLVDIEKTPLHRAYDMVKLEAEAHGVSPTWSEIVGLVPERALFETAARHIQLRDFSPDVVLERKVRDAMSGGVSLTGFVSSVASSMPTPGGGSVAALVGSLAAALAQMVAGLTVGRKKYAAVEAEMKELALEAADVGNQLAALVDADARSYTAASNAYKLPKEPEAAAVRRAAAITEALLGASRVPLETARACARVAELAAVVATRGNSNAVSDAGVAALLAEAACRGAAYNVRINVAALEDKSRGSSLAAEATELVARTASAAASATAAVEAAI